MPVPNIDQALGDSYTGRPVTGPNPGAYRPEYMDAPYLPYEIQNELLGVWGASVAPKEYRQLLSCGSGDAVGAAVRISATNTVTTALADTQAHSNAIGFIRDKPSTTTCYISHYFYSAALSGGTAGNPIYLADDGSFTATPGTIQKVVGVYDSLNSGHLVVNPVVPGAVVLAQAQFKTVAITADYTVLPDDYSIIANATSAPITVSLPPAAGIEGQILVIKKIDNMNDVIVFADGTDTIDAVNSNVITTQYASITIQSDGTNWNIIGSYL